MKLSKSWMSFFYEFEPYKIGTEFNDQFNRQLQSEFELLTGKKFDGRYFFLHIKGLNDFSYYQEAPLPYGKLEAVLLFYERRMDVSIIWYDRVSKKLFKPGDNIEGFDVEFHWEKFDILNPALNEVGTKRKDIRNKFGWNMSFPIISRYTVFETDIELKILVKTRREIEEIEKVLGVVQEVWNASSLNQDISNVSDFKGIVHSIEFIDVDENANAVFSVDRGTANDDFFKFLFHKLEDSNLAIKRIEIVNV